MKSPRLKHKDHKISSTLIKAAGTPLALFTVSVCIVSYVLYQVLFPGFDEIWGFPKLTLVIGSAGLLIGMLDIISNAYQEVSADTRQAEIMQLMDHRNQTMIDRLDQIEHLLTNTHDEPRNS